MAKHLDLKLVIKHLSNGTLGENLCIICLESLHDKFENIFTKICKEDDEFCVADVLHIVAKIKFSKEDNYNVCVDCYTSAFMAYKFYLLSSRTNEVLNYYYNTISNSLDDIDLHEEFKSNTLCYISLPTMKTVPMKLDFNLQGIGNSKDDMPKLKSKRSKHVRNEDDDNIVVIVQENGDHLFYKSQPDGVLVLLDDLENQNYRKKLSKTVVLPKTEVPKIRKKRQPMTHKLCSRCPVKYRFAAKLKEHMKIEHNINLFICKICKAINEDEVEYYNHMQTHTNIHQCDICHTVFKKRDTIINHLKWHERMKNISKTDGAHICEICGVITEDENSLRDHYDIKHYKKYTCYYCGRQYKGELSFEMHIKKHEAKTVTSEKKVSEDSPKQEENSTTAQKDVGSRQKCMCVTCGRYFVDERALMWHQRLHNNDRPFKCEICGRAFVSVNRRNQHALCAHTAPTRRCPLCPALFHLRSMVNTHIRKVHLKAHKRRNRVSKHQNVFWRTEPVPIQDLSVDIQNDILELQAAKKEHQIFNSTRMMEFDDL